MQETFELYPFIENELDLVLRSKVQLDKESLQISFYLETDLTHLVIPEYSKNCDRKNELWKTTCFELFVKNSFNEYLEFNFSPSTHWNVYQFEKYREKMTECKDIEIVEIDSSIKSCLELNVHLKSRLFCEFNQKFHPCAVIEHKGSGFFYYSNVHCADKPDFHLF